MRKLEPFRRAIAGYPAWVTGVRREQSAGARARAGRGVGRASTAVQAQPAARLERGAGVAVHPRARLPYNALHDRHYPSIGCVALHARHPAGREPPRRPLVVGATRVARMRSASQDIPRRRRACGTVRLKRARRAMDYLPVFLRLEGRAVRGGRRRRGGAAQGELAAQGRRARDGRRARAACRSWPSAAERGEIRHMRRRVQRRTPRRRGRGGRRDRRRAAVNRAVSASARARDIPVNVVDDADALDVHLPRHHRPLAAAGGGELRRTGAGAGAAGARADRGAAARAPRRARALHGRAARGGCSARSAPAARRAFWERMCRGQRCEPQLLAGDEAAARRSFAQRAAHLAAHGRARPADGGARSARST